MELRHLRCFLAVAEELHFARAAEKLHIEQSPLSRTIKELEEDVGEQLFIRTGRSTRLMRAGKLLLEHVTRVKRPGAGIAGATWAYAGSGCWRANSWFDSEIATISFLVMSISTTLKTWAKRIKRDGVTLWFAGKHPRTPWYAKALGVFVVAYALSPIDLIPDFIPVLGYVDDVILLPVLIWLTVRMLPPEVLAQCRSQADEWMRVEGAKPKSRFGAVLIVGLWLAAGIALWIWLKPHL